MTFDGETLREALGATVEVLPLAAGLARVERQGLSKTLGRALTNIHFCKAERYADLVLGTIAAPEKSEHRKTEVFAFLLVPDRLIFLDDHAVVGGLLARAQENGNWATLPTFLIAVLETLIENDLAYLQQLESNIVAYEETLLSGELAEFSAHYMQLNHKIVAFDRYYLQLIDLCDNLYDSALLSDVDRAQLERFAACCARLEGEAQMLRESLLQLRSEYQAQIELKQNGIMQILTVVTTVFMPLTLIVGWYGMNFNIPELSWRYGYPAVCVLSAVIVVVTVWLCKRKKFF